MAKFLYVFDCPSRSESSAATGVHIPTSAAALFLFLILSLSLLACDAIGGKPNPARAKGIDDPVEQRGVCSQIRSEISDWERRKIDDTDDAFLRGRKGLFEGARESEEVNAEANRMRRELDRHCSGSSSPSQRTHHPTPTPYRR